MSSHRDPVPTSGRKPIPSSVVVTTSPRSTARGLDQKTAKITKKASKSKTKCPGRVVRGGNSLNLINSKDMCSYGVSLNRFFLSQLRVRSLKLVAFSARRIRRGCITSCLCPSETNINLALPKRQSRRHWGMGGSIL